MLIGYKYADDDDDDDDADDYIVLHATMESFCLYQKIPISRFPQYQPTIHPHLHRDVNKNQPTRINQLPSNKNP